jgi:glycosyltransferase involved in cell wall biosynthesis
MTKIIHILPHNIEDFMAGDYHNFDHHLVRFLVKINQFQQQGRPQAVLQQELWVASKKLKKMKEVQHEKGFQVKLFPISLKLPLPLEISFPLMRAVWQQAKQTGIIWHLHSYYLWMNDFLSLILAIKKRPFLVHFRGGGFSNSARGFLYSLFHHLIGLRFSLGLAKLAFIQNQDEIKRVRQWRLANPSKIIYFPNSIPLSEIKPKQNFSFQKEQGLKTIIAGRIAKITRRKENLQILQIILTDYPSFYLEIIGLKQKSPALEELKNTFPERFILTSWLNKKELLEKIRQADLLLYITEREGSPMGLIEAQSQGLPVISFDAEGVRDIIKNGFNGYLVNNIQELPIKIKELLGDPQKLRIFSQNAVENIKKNFIDEKYFPKLIDVYLNR